MTLLIFSQDQLKKVVDTELQQLPDGHSNAIIGTVDQNGTQVVVAFKKSTARGSTWQATGALKHDWNGDNSVGAKVVYSW